MGKIRIWSLFFIPYFNLVSNLSIMSIYSVTFQYCINLVSTIISWMKITNVAKVKIKKLVSIYVAIK